MPTVSFKMYSDEDLSNSDINCKQPMDLKRSKKYTVKLIRLYRSYPLLWDVNNNSYRRRDLKKKAYDDIAKKMNMTVDMVKKKIHSLRSTYTGEKRKMEASKTAEGGEEYVPSLAWYGEMYFLDSSITSRKAMLEHSFKNQSKLSTGWDQSMKIVRVETRESLQPEIQEAARTLSTHVLDTSRGKAAPKVPIVVYRLLEDEQWQELSMTFTDEDGRVSQLLEKNNFKSGIYKLKFDVEKYFSSSSVKCFYPFIEIVVKCVQSKHYHIPLLISPFSYSTYKGT